MHPLRNNLVGWLAICVGCLCLSWPAFCEAADGDDVIVNSSDGQVHEGPLAALTNRAVRLGGDDGIDLAVEEVVSLSWESRKPAVIDRGSVVFLANGDRFVVQPLQIDGEVLRARWRTGAGPSTLEFPLERVRGFVLKVPSDRHLRAKLFSQLLDHAQKQDVLVLTNSDRTTGQLLTVDEQKFEFEAAGVGRINIPRKGVIAASMNSELIDFPHPKGIRALVTLVDGTRFTAVKFELAQDGLVHFQAAYGGKFELPVQRLAMLQVLGGNVVYLSDLQPSSYRFTPYLSLKWPLRQDRSVTGGRLRLRGREYAKGLGMHSHSEAEYRLDGAYRKFQAVVGIDDETEGRGSATFRVLLDGRPVFTSDPMTGESPPVTLDPIDVGGAKTITLVVDFGELGDVADHANWCDAMLIK